LEPAAQLAAPPTPAEMRWDNRAMPTQAQPMAVRQGPAPLVYLLESPANVRVVDEARGVTLTAAPVPRRTVIRIDERNGVVFGQETVSPGPLPAGGRYVIYLDPTGKDYSRQGTYQPRPR
jgi:hypothetical protein